MTDLFCLIYGCPQSNNKTEKVAISGNPALNNEYNTKWSIGLI